VLALVALAALLAAVAPARFDKTYGEAGVARVELTGPTVAEALLLQRDGKAVVSGALSAGTSSAFIARFDTRGGQHDITFRDDAGVDQIPALAEQPDGRLLAAWQTLTTRGETVIYHVRLVRLALDWTPDLNVDLFNGGAPGLQGGGPAGAQAIAVQPDGKIVVLLGTALFRLNAGGSQDFRVDFGPSDVARALALGPGGRILVAGTRGSSPFVDAYRADGTVDPTFHAALQAGNPQSLAVLPDGRIDVATRSHVERLLTSGALETTGAVPGSAVSLDAAGRIVAAGKGGIRRLTSSLMPDGTFGAAGTAGLGGIDPVGVAVQPNGKTLVAGTLDGHAIVERLAANVPIRRPVVIVMRRPAPPGHATFAFHADTPGATFRCALDDGSLRPCRSPVAYWLAAGRHHFYVQALGGGVTGPTAIVRFSVR
jgi:uncharacterized delta-60 repeat protein